MPDPRVRVQVFVAVVALGVALLAGAWYGSRPSELPPVTLAGSSGPTTTGILTVHVSGAVASPGLVSIAAGSRVADAVAAAGGALPTADLGALNLAAPVQDSDRIEVPAVGDPASPSSAGSTAPSGIDLNLATAAELDGALPGVGPVLAERIVAYREAHGPFAAVEDLLDVPGIGEAKLAAMREAISAP